MRLGGKTALITGAAGGLGEAMARRFASEGARVAIADIKEAEGRAVAESIGAAATFIKLDVTQETDWTNAVQACGKLDVLVNNAGITKVQGIEDITVDDFHPIMNVDVLGVILGCKHGILSMKETGGGSIINVASALAKVAEPQTVMYAGAKAAVCSATKSIALHCAERDYSIRCNAILPGIFMTEMLEQAINSMPDPEAARKQWEAKQPTGRLGRVEEMADLATYLASDASAFMTGSELVLDGGNILS